MHSIEFWHSLGGPPKQVLEEIVATYNQETPQALVNLTFISTQSEYQEAINTALGLEPSEQPDLVLAPEFITGMLNAVAKKAQIHALNTLLNEERLKTIPPLIRATFGEYSLPFNPACGVVYVNENALAAIDYDRQWRPKNLTELKKACSLMLDKKIVEQGWSTAWPEAYLVEVVLAQQNLPLVMPDNGKSGEGRYNFEQLTDHLCELWEQRQAGVFLPPKTGNYDLSRLPFIDGKLGFYIQGSGHANRIYGEADKNGVTVGYGPVPTLNMNYSEPKYAFPLGGAALWAFNTKKIENAVKTFLNYLTSPEVQERWHRETCYLPINTEVIAQLKQTSFYATHPVHQAVVEQTLESPMGEYSCGIKMPNYSEVRALLYPMLYELLYLEGDVAEVKSKISSRLKAFDDQWSQL